MASSSAQDHASNDDTAKMIVALDEGLKRYYQSLHKEYASQFAKWCTENGYEDDDTLHDELNEEVEDCSLPGFLEENADFPFPTDDVPQTEMAKKERLLEILKQIRDDPQCAFVVDKDREVDHDGNVTMKKTKSHRPQLVEVDNTIFDGITVDDISALTEKYQDQVPLLCSRQLLTDYTLLQILAAGNKRGFGYLSLLSDEYSRCRVRAFVEDKKELTVAEWANPKHHPHFKKLQDLEVRMVSSQSARRMPYHELVQSAIKSYQTRITKRFEFSPPYKIDNSIEIVVEHFIAALKFVKHNVAEIKGTNCPFQVDLCLATGPPLMEQDDFDDFDSDDEDDDDDDESKDEEEAFTDYVGDIESKLKANHLEYHKCTVAKVLPKGPKTDDMVKRQNWLTRVNAKDDLRLHRKRLVALVDRRNKDELTE